METFSAVLAICARNSPVSGEFPAQRPVTRSFDVFFDLLPNKRLSKQSLGWWFETPSGSLWRHSNEVGRSNSWYLPRYNGIEYIRMTQWPVGNLLFLITKSAKHILVNDKLSFFHKIPISWIPLDHIKDNSTWIQMRAWCRPTTSHFLNNWWAISLSHVCVTKLLE